ncbi:LCP family glycopolymer transferase, partial [Staphylococcus aureus]
SRVFFQAEDGIRDRSVSRGLGDVYKRQPEYYAVVDFTGFEKMIDELMPEGVPINVEKDMSKNIGVSLKKGNHR